METSVRKVNLRRKVMLCFFGALIVLPPLFVGASALWSTVSAGPEGLGEEHYAHKVMLSYWVPLMMMCMLAGVFVPMIIVFNRLFNRRVAVLYTLSSGDILRAMHQNQRLNFWEKYMPAYTIRGSELIIFKVLKNEIVRLPAIQKMEVRRIRQRGPDLFRVKLQTVYGPVKMHFSSSSEQLPLLIKELLEVHPRLEITHTNGWF